MNKRKILTMAMALCMVAILAIGGTLAYFTDSEQKTNVMTIGNVQIDLDELTKVGTNEDGTGIYKPFTDYDDKLYPISDDQGINLFNKMVYTFNTSKSEDDAYIRTIILVEENSEYECPTGCCLNGLHFGYTNGTYTFQGQKVHASTNEVLGTMNYNGKNYQVIVFTAAEKEAIPVNEALATMNSVWIDKDIDNDTVKGWGDDGQIDILVLSQGIQADGLTHDAAMEALGEITAETLPTLFKDVKQATINTVFTNK